MLEKEWNRCVRSVRSASLVMVGADFFNEYDGMCGHLAGDECPNLVAKQATKDLDRSIPISTADPAPHEATDIRRTPVVLTPASVGRRKKAFRPPESPFPSVGDAQEGYGRRIPNNWNVISPVS